MSLAETIARRFERRLVDADALTFSGLGLPPVKSGVQVNVNTALQVSTVFACTRVLAEGIAQLPCKLLQEKDNGAKVPAKKHPLYRVLSRRPNSWMTSFEFRETLSYHAILAKGGFAYIARVGGEVDELIPLIPNQVTVRYPRTLAGEVSYGVSTRLGSMELSKNEVLHIRGPSWDGYAGMDAVQLAREAIGLAIATEESQSKLHANGGRPGGILSTDSTIEKKKKDNLRAEWVEKFGPTGRAFGLAVLDEGLKFQSLAMSGVDAQHLETRRHQVEEICRMFRVFPQMVGYSDKTATFASAEAFFLAHVVHSLGPWVERWEQVLDRDLLSEKELDAGYMLKLIVQALMRGDTKSRSEYFKAGLGTASSPGWLSPNDVRRLEDLDPSDDPAADEIVTPEKMTGKTPPAADPAAPA